MGAGPRRRTGFASRRKRHRQPCEQVCLLAALVRAWLSLPPGTQHDTTNAELSLRLRTMGHISTGCVPWRFCKAFAFKALRNRPGTIGGGFCPLKSFSRFKGQLGHLTPPLPRSNIMQVLAVGLGTKKEFAFILVSFGTNHRKQAMEHELWLQLYAIAVRLDNIWTKGFYRASEIVVVYLWAVIHDRPTCWACHRCNWHGCEPCLLPSQSTMSCRLRSGAVVELLLKIEQELGGDPRQWWVQRTDSKPLPVGPHSKDRDAK